MLAFRSCQPGLLETGDIVLGDFSSDELHDAQVPCFQAALSAVVGEAIDIQREILGTREVSFRMKEPFLVTRIDRESSRRGVPYLFLSSRRMLGKVFYKIRALSTIWALLDCQPVNLSQSLSNHCRMIFRPK